MEIFLAKTVHRLEGRMLFLCAALLFIFMAGCAFNFQDEKRMDENLRMAIKNCKKEMLLRDPYLGPFWRLSKDFKPCMKGADHYK